MPRLLHNPNLVATGLSVGYETWPPIGWHCPFGIGWTKYILGSPSAPLHYGLTWPVGIPTVFQTPVTVPLHSPNGRPAVRAVQGDCERVLSNAWRARQQPDSVKRQKNEKDHGLLDANIMQLEDGRMGMGSRRNVIRLLRFFILNTLRLRQNYGHLTEGIFWCIFLNENVWISLKISLKFVQRFVSIIFQCQSR